MSIISDTPSCPDCGAIMDEHVGVWVCANCGKALEYSPLYQPITYGEHRRGLGTAATTPEQPLPGQGGVPGECPPAHRSTVLEEAEFLVAGTRRVEYGHPHESFGKIAQCWSAYLGIPVARRDVANLMVLLKICRDSDVPKRDNHVDAAGYLRCAELAEEDRG
jgi:hypothetical protein